MKNNISLHKEHTGARVCEEKGEITVCEWKTSLKITKSNSVGSKLMGEAKGVTRFMAA
jgi:hypothetical protein